MAEFKKNKSTFASAFIKKSPFKNDHWAKKFKELISPASNDTLHPTLQSMGKGMASHLVRSGMSKKDVVTFIQETDKKRKAQDKNK